MAEIRWTEEAQRWLRDIHDYIAMDDPDAAQKVEIKHPLFDTVSIIPKTASRSMTNSDIV